MSDERMVRVLKPGSRAGRNWEDVADEMMGHAFRCASVSPDKSTQTGAVIWQPTYNDLFFGAWNDFPPGSPHVQERPEKYTYIEHSERAVIYAAAKAGFALAGATMFHTWAACADCARAIVLSGVERLVRHVPPQDEAVERWRGTVEAGDRILLRGGVEIVEYDKPLPNAAAILRDGVPFQP